MESLLAVAAQALSRGDPLVALKLVALQTAPHALALRATALSQLAEYSQAKVLFKRAARALRAAHPLAHARCLVALAELALVTRDLSMANEDLERATEVLMRHADAANAQYAQLIHARYALALGQLEAAEERLLRIDLGRAAPLLRALFELAVADLAVRRVRPDDARRALTRAGQAALRAQVPALISEVQSAKQALSRPVARLMTKEGPKPLAMEEVAQLLSSSHLLVDACRRQVQQGKARVRFETRPVAFALLRRLAEASPQPVSREELIRVGFGMGRPNDSLRARLRVALGRLRKQLRALAELRATSQGFVLVPRASGLHVLAPPLDDDASQLLALLSDGQAWSTSALALALGSSQRSVQRALQSLLSLSKVSSFGRGKSRRWLASPLHPFATHMLLPAPSLPR